MLRENRDEEQAYGAAGVEHQPAPPLLVGARPGSHGHKTEAQNPVSEDAPEIEVVEGDDKEDPRR